MQDRLPKHDDAALKERALPVDIGEADKHLFVTASGERRCKVHNCAGLQGVWGLYFCPQCKKEAER